MLPYLRHYQPLKILVWEKWAGTELADILEKVGPELGWRFMELGTSGPEYDRIVGGFHWVEFFHD